MTLRSRVWGAMLVALVPFLLLVARFDFLTDDGYISFRYARNLVRGWGLAYNDPAVEAPVEGYSEFLWVILLAAAAQLGLALETVSRVVSVATGMALVVLVVRALARRAQGAPVALCMSALVLGTLTPLAVWSTGGMGTMPFLLALVVMFDQLLGDPGRPRGVGAALAAAAVVLLRADGALWVAFVLGGGALVGIVRRDRALLRAALLAIGVSVFVFGVHVAWRYATYGDWLPNTARVKVGFSAAVAQRGWMYVAGVSLALLSLPACILVAVCAAPRGFERRDAVAFGVVGGTLAYAIFVGGDFMCFGRFLLPVWPMLVLILGAAFARHERARPGWPVRSGVVLTGLVLATLSLLPAFDVHPVSEETRLAYDYRYKARHFQSEYGRWRGAGDKARSWVLLGRAIRSATQPGESIVLGAIGAVGYHTELFVYDRYGLVTRDVALRERDPQRRLSSPGHDKTVPISYFFDRNPTYVAARIRGPDGKAIGTNMRKAPRTVVSLVDVEGFGSGWQLGLVHPPSDGASDEEDDEDEE